MLLRLLLLLLLLLVLESMPGRRVLREYFREMLLLVWCSTSLGSGAVVAAGPMGGVGGARVRGRRRGELEGVEGGRGRKPLRLRRTSSAWSYGLWCYRMCRWSCGSASGS